jgi:hypothetical protein
LEENTLSQQKTLVKIHKRKTRGKPYSLMTNVASFADFHHYLTGMRLHARSASPTSNPTGRYGRVQAGSGGLH